MVFSLLPRAARRLTGLTIALLGLSITAPAQTRVLFVGNSFTHGQYSPVLNYNSAAVTDLNYNLPASDPRAHDAGMTAAFGGVPGIFKKFTVQAGLNYDVQLEAISGKTLQYHYTNALSVIGQAGWDKVVLQEQSSRPVPDARGGNRSLFYNYSTLLEQAVHTANPAAQVYLYQTWGRPDFTYPNGQPYSNLPIDSMTRDLHNSYYRAFATNGHYVAVAPVGDAFLRAITAGVAMRDPYNPDASKVNLWASDYVHPSAWGSYLSACVLFYQLTGTDPRTLGSAEQAAAALGITPTQAVALQLTAYQQVVAPSPVNFTPGNVAVVRVGDGTAALTSAATAEFVDEYTLSGTRVQSIAMPTTDNGNIRAFTNSGTATSDNITNSVDGRYLLLPGYNAAPGTAGIVTSTVATNNRLIARIAADGSVDTNTRITDAFSGSNIRSAASIDGSAFYASGGNSGIRYLPFGNTGATTALSSSTVVNFRILGIAGGNLYASSAGNSNYGVNQIGTGLPTAAGATVALLPGFPTASGASSYGFYFADLSTTVAGMDVVYVADDNTTGGIQKWCLVGSTWTLKGTIGGSTTALLRGLTGIVSGTSVQLIASGGGGLYKVTDNAGYNVAPTTTTLPAPFVAPAANTSFRGVALTPIATVTVPNSTALVSTSQSPANGSVPYGGTVTVTLNLGGTPLANEYFYMIYSADGFANKTAVAPTTLSGTTATFALPNQTSVANPSPSVRYYFVSSSSTTVADETSANYPYINILNASGANYGFSYTGTTLASTSRNPATTSMPYGSPVTVTLNLGSTPTASEYFYLIYTNNSFTTRTAIAASSQSGTTVTFTLPSATIGVAYFLVSSPAATAAAEISAGYPYIRILNNSGGNYGYGIAGLCGPYTIDNTSGAGTSGTNFNSFTAAVAALNSYGITCATTITVKDGSTYTEVVPALGSATLNASLSATNTLTFVRSNTAGAKPILNAGTGTGTRDAVLTLAGADYVTLDGLDLREGSSNGTAATAATEYGVWLTHRTATDGSQNNTVRNCAITLNNAAASAPVGVQFSTTTAAGAAAAATSAAGANSSNMLYGNTISNVQQGIVLLGNTSSFYDLNNAVAPTTQPGNIITFGNGGTSSIDANGQQGLTVGNNTITSTSTGNTSLLQGIVLQSGNSTTGTTTVVANIVKGLVSSGSVVGIVANGPASLSRNKVVDLVTTGASTTTTGLSATGGTLTASNNLVGDLRAPASTSSSAVVGINASVGTWNIYNNTVYLAASSSATTSAFATSGILFGTNAVDLRNNIVVNKSVAGLTGSTVALRGAAAGAAASLASTTNNNLYFASTIYGEGMNAELLLTSRQTTIAGYRSLMSPRETAAVSEDVPFISVTSSDATYLHISPSTPTLAESGGTAITGLSTDYDGDLRYGQTGYPGASPNSLGQTLGGGNTPDIGADEATFVPAALTWTGSTSTDWFDTTNWNGYLPNALTDTTIPATVPSNRMPVINSPTLVAATRNLTLQSAGILSSSLTLSGTSQLNIAGDFSTPNGAASVASSGSTMAFLGSTAQNIGAGTYGNLTLSGSGTAAKVLTGDIIVGGNLDLSNAMLTQGASDVTMAAGTGTVVGASASHFLVQTTGHLCFNDLGGSRASALYPIGTSANSYTPTTLNNTGTPDQLCATVQNNVSNTSATTHYVNKQWDISEGTIGGSNVSLTLQWNAVDEANGFVRSSSAIAHYENGAWNTACFTCFGAAVGNDPYTQSRSGITTFSPFAIEDNAKPLPVTMTRFEATRKGSDAELSWSTASEKNNAGFEVQVSTNGKSFRTLHFTESSSANSASPRSYTYADRETGKASLRYYRLRQLDIDGTASVSPVRSVDFGQASNTELTAAPNPFTSQLTLTVPARPAATTVLLTVTDATGRVVRAEKPVLQADTSEITLYNLEGLPAGIYLLHVAIGGQTKHLKIMK